MNDKKITQKLSIILLILISVAIIIIAFVGIYVQNLNKLKDIVPEATYSSEIDGTIEYRLSVDTTEEEKEVYVDDDGNIMGFVEDGNDTSDDEWENYTGYTVETITYKTNSDDILTLENYEKAKSIIENRLDSMGATEYSIRLNEETGDISIELSENDDIETLYETALCTTGEFRVIDYQTGVVLIDQSNIKSISAYSYSSDGLTYTAYMLIEFDDEGTELLTQLSNTYIEYTDDDGETQTDCIAIQIDGSTIYRTYFGEEYTSSTIMIPIGEGIADEETLQAYIDTINIYASLFEYGKLPVIYSVESTGGYLVRTNIDDTVLGNLEIALIIILIIIAIVYAVRYGKKGLIAGVFNAAFIGLLILVLKYLSIVVSISSMFSIVIMVLINMLFFEKYLKSLKDNKDNAFWQSFKSFYGVIFPFVIVAFVFTVSSVNATITGIGMTLFWGLIIELLFNMTISKYVLDKIEK